MRVAGFLLDAAGGIGLVLLGLAAIGIGTSNLIVFG